MSKSIDNAAEIIEKFGGIRPMSTKIDVAVTTIQGWKKRGCIPAARKGLILKTALKHEIDLSSFFDDAPSVVKVVEKVEETTLIEKPVVKPAVDSRQTAPENKNFTEIAIAAERDAIAKGAIIAAAVILVLFAASVFMIWSSFKESDDRIAMIEGDLTDIKNAQSPFKGFVPENWSKQLSELKQQVEQAKNTVTDTVDDVKDIIQTDGLEDRVVKLQSYVSEIAGDSGIYSLLARFGDMENNVAGKSVLDNAVLEISSILAGAEGKDDSYINNALNSARAQNAAIQQTLGDVPQSELKAAAMLLALTQVRSSLNRSDEAFDNDLALLMNMVGDDNPELKNSLEKLSPHAKTGLLSPSGLQSEFRTLAGEVVAASLSGEDVSFSEKASARMNDILQIEKDGELITGTKIQAKVKKADKMMQNGDLGGAVSYLKKSLSAKELKPLQPWIKQAEGVLDSAKLKKVIEQAIELNVGRGYLGGSQLLND